MRLEYDYKTRSDSAHKQILELKADMESMQIVLNEKISQNKKLYQDYTGLQSLLETKSNEINHLRHQLNEFMQVNSRLVEEKIEIEKIVVDLRDSKTRIKKEIDRIYDENQRLNKNCKDEEILIKNLEAERNKYIEFNEQLKYDNSNLQTKIKQRDENLNYYQKQLDESNKTILRLNGHIKDLENKNEVIHQELDMQNNTNQKEIRSRIEKEKAFDETERSLKEKEREIKIALEELEILSIQKDKLYEDNTKMYNEIDRLKNQINKH